MGKLLMIAGVLLLACGAMLHFAPGSLNWFGRLPGDIRLEGERGGFYLPLTSMVLASVALSLLLAWLRR